MDAGNNGVIILADKMLPPRKHGVLIPGPQAHAMKLRFEKYFLRKARHGYVQLPLRQHGRDQGPGPARPNAAHGSRRAGLTPCGHAAGRATLRTWACTRTRSFLARSTWLCAVVSSRARAPGSRPGWTARCSRSGSGRA